MTINEFVKIKLKQKNPNLETIYEQLMRMGYKAEEIFYTIQMQVYLNMQDAVTDYLKKKKKTHE
jgi:hypothetical protein